MCCYCLKLLENLDNLIISKRKQKINKSVYIKEKYYKQHSDLKISFFAASSFKYQNIFRSQIFQFSSVTQSCPSRCDPMNHSTLGLPVHHQLPEFSQTHVHCVSDAIQPSHPLSSPSPPALNLSQHRGLFK